MPAYIICGDTTLRALAHFYPTSPDQLEGIPGIGEKKRAEFGAVLTAEISHYLKTNSRMAFD